MTIVHFYQTQIGKVGIATDEGSITHIFLPGEPGPDGAVDGESALMRETVQQIEEYLSGKRRKFTVPYKLTGSSFAMRVWEQLRDIPYGETRSYGQTARSIGSPGAARAVGQAVHRNPLSIIIPCHRVIGAKGDLVGYVGGMPLKKRLLGLEQENGHI